MIGMYIGLLLALGVCVLLIAITHKAQKGMNYSSYQSMVKYGIETQLFQDKHDLHRFGIAQLLARRWGRMSAFGMSCNVMALIGSASLLFGPAIHTGGLSIAGYGLPIIGLFSLCVSVCLAELSSAIPTSGHIYHAAGKLGGRKWGVRAGWFHAVGHLALLALYIGGCAYIADTIASAMIGYKSSAISFWGFIIIIVSTQAAMNHWGTMVLGWISKCAVWVQLFIAVSILAGLVWFFWPGGYSPVLLYHFQNFNFDGNVQINSYILGCLLLLKLFIGMDGASLGAEETIEPRIRVPWAIFLSTAYTFVIGYVLLLFMGLVTGLTGGSEQAISYARSIMGLDGIELFVQTAMAGWGGSSIIALMIVISLWVSGQHSMFVCSRALFSLARDESMPFSNRLAKVCVRRQQPIHGGWFSGLLSICIIIVVLVIRDGGLILPLLSIAIITLHISYAIPIGLRLKERWDAKYISKYGANVSEHLWTDAPWRLGTWSMPIHGIAFLWLIGSAILTAIFVDLIGVISVAILLLAMTTMDMGYSRERKLTSHKSLAHVPNKRTDKKAH
ncbi:amino acid permease [Paenibacillus sp. L3-i20]|uniref:amino acid permease n=1 Tax=Paenibacillus sp. L3-i20 TaxID=2905833 RepID=UPI001EE151E7|nr:amino acid permease [Paenibacillus sp. L3-i20]GKU79236.1 amino acid permease [Paenibacillus sp. L3-i20]